LGSALGKLIQIRTDDKNLALGGKNQPEHLSPVLNLIQGILIDVLHHLVEIPAVAGKLAGKKQVRPDERLIDLILPMKTDSIDAQYFFVMIKQQRYKLSIEPKPHFVGGMHMF
jgi:hypothetical protein